MTLDIHNWSSSAHQELLKIVKYEIYPIVNQVDSRVQNFEIQFLKEAVKFVRDFKSLAKEADESLAKHKALEYEIKRLLRAVISYDKAYNDMQNQIKRLQAQLRDLKGKSSDTQCASNTLDPLSQKLEDENAYQFLDKPPSSSGPKLYFVTPLPKSKVISKVGESNALLKPVTSNSTPSSRESTLMNNERVIDQGIFRINPFKASRVDKLCALNKHVKESAKTKTNTVSKPMSSTKKM
ncbi:hypothetical protein Tco_0538725 [Tanacetum coccineum]